MRVGVVFGGRSVEHRVSVVSARTVAAGLAAAGHRAVPLGVAQDGGWVDRATAARALAGELDALPPLGIPVVSTLERLLDDPPEAIFPIVHGTWGEDGTLQGLCEMLDLPYVGADVTASAVAMDKLAAKRLLAAAGLPVVEHECVIGDHAYLSPGVILSGQVMVEAGAFLGAGAVVLPGLRIGAGAVVAAGAVVTADVPAGQTVMGVPARAAHSGESG
jgi:D-alanine-D-alanine ligase